MRAGDYQIVDHTAGVNRSSSQIIGADDQEARQVATVGSLNAEEQSEDEDNAPKFGDNLNVVKNRSKSAYVVDTIERKNELKSRLVGSTTEDDSESRASTDYDKLLKEWFEEDDEDQILENHHAESLYVDFYAAAFYSMITKHKKEYKLSTGDSADYFMECLFVLTIKVFLCIALLYNSGDSISFINTDGAGETSNMIYSTLILCVMVLHFSLVSTLRNGVQMMKYVVFHPEDFQNPQYAFFLGICIVVVIVFIEVTNILF